MSTVRPFEVTQRGVLAIAIPMTIAYLSTPLLGIVDTAVIGQLGRADLLGGIAVGAVVFDILFATFNFLRSGTTGLTAQAVGAEDQTAQTATLYRSALIGLIAGALIIALQVPLLAVSLGFMGASEPVNAAVSEYFAIRALGAPVSLLNYAILGWFLGLGRAGTGLGLQLLLNGLNMALNVTFVLWLGWGVAGVAWGTVIGETVTAIVGVLLAWRTLGANAFIPLAALTERLGLIRTFSVNRDIMIRSFSLLLVFALFTSAGARQTDVVLAANAILMNLFIFGSYFLDGFATAAEQLAGRAVGARYRPAFSRAVALTLAWGYALAAALSVVLLVAGPAIIDLLTTSPEVRSAARHFLVWAALTPLFGVAAFEFDGVFIGATWSDDMRNMMLVSLAVYLLVWLVATPLLGNHGLWLALAVFLLVRGLTLAARYPLRLQRTFPEG
ncbi:MATE family efflux transporter [Microbaculum marinum]|uniref:MATE family efflux transporter n=1 Tax=Microbaculum marinum TaxID=1764581 RepID=A0AAW9RUA6_9HYPH